MTHFWLAEFCSWKEGHKNACDELKITYERLKNDEERVLRAIEEGVEGIRPTPQYDLGMILDLMVDETRTMFVFPPDLLERFPHPSMDNFYRSLSSIIRGEDHWLFPDTPNPTFCKWVLQKRTYPGSGRKGIHMRSNHILHPFV